MFSSMGNAGMNYRKLAFWSCSHSLLRPTWSSIFNYDKKNDDNVKNNLKKNKTNWFKSTEYSQRMSWISDKQSSNCVIELKRSGMKTASKLDRVAVKLRGSISRRLISTIQTGISFGRKNAGARERERNTAAPEAEAVEISPRRHKT